jgi:hypothetical protein
MQTRVIVGLWFCLICNGTAAVRALVDLSWATPKALVYARTVGQGFAVATLLAVMLHLGLI